MILGTKQNPYRIASADWIKNGCPYGSYCKCYQCNRVAQSTVMFDFYAKVAGEYLKCEACSRVEWAKEIKKDNDERNKK